MAKRNDYETGVKYVELNGGNSDGSINVHVMSGGGGEGGGSLPPVDFTLQNAASAVGNGTLYEATRGNEELTFVVTGTSTSRTIKFEIADPISGVFVPHTAFSVTSPATMVTETTDGNDTVPSSWSADVPAGYKFRARISAVAGGNVSVKGKAVV